MAILTIQGKLAGLNDYTRACRSNRYIGAKMKADAEAKITACIKQQIPNIHFDGAVELKFRWYEPNKKRDLDNALRRNLSLMHLSATEQSLLTGGKVLSDLQMNFS